MVGPIRVLILEDRPSAAPIIVQQLRAFGFELDWTRIDTETAFLSQLESPPDIILADDSSVGFGMHQALQRLRERGLDIPLIVIAGSLAEEAAIDALKQGAADYLLKDRLGRLGPAVENAIHQKRLRTRVLELEAKELPTNPLSRSPVNTSLIGIQIIQDGKYTFANSTISEIFGYTHAELLALDSWTAVVAKHDRTKVLDREQLPHSQEVQYVFRGLRKDQSEMEVEILTTSLELQGSPATLGILRDLTNTTLSEAESQPIPQPAADLLKAIADESPDAMFAKDLQGKYLLFNRAAARFVGRKIEDVLGRDDRALFDARSAEFVMHRDQRVIRSGQVETFEEELNASGSLRTYLATKAPYRDRSGNVIGTLGISRDITDQKRAQVALAESNQRFSETLEAVSDLFAAFDREWNYTYVNSKAAAFTYHAPHELIGKNLWTMFPEAVGGRFYEELHEAVATQTIRTFEEVNRESGRGFEHRAYPHPRGLSLFSADITERQQAEMALRESQAKLAEAIRLAQMGHWRRDLVTGVLEWSDELFAIFGIDPQKFGATFESFLSMIHPNDQQRVRNRIAQAVADKGAFTHTYRILVDGEIKAIYESGQAVASAEGKAIRVVGTAQDVTTRFKAEDALRESEERMRHVIISSPFPAMVHTEDGTILLISNSWTALTGYTLEDIPNLETLARKAYGERQKEQLERITRVNHLTTRQHVGEFELQTKSGTELIWDFWATPLGRLPNGRRFVLRMAVDVTEQKRTEDELKLRDRAIQAVTHGILITDPALEDNPIIYASPGFGLLTGYSTAEIMGRNCRFMQGPETDPVSIERIRTAIRERRSCVVEILNYRKDGTTFWNELRISPVRDARGQVTHFVGSQSDVTARRKLQDQLRQVQKMEAVGRLAGGVAHDFNNLVTIINGYSDLVLEGMPQGQKITEFVRQIKRAGERAAALTKQLLAFSRLQMLQSIVVDLNGLILDMETMLQRLIGEDIQLNFELAPDLKTIIADPGQMEQVLLNLIVNARDSISDVGSVTVKTSNVDLHDSYLSNHPDAPSGPHVLMTVSDTGCGIDKATLAQIFEPFFSTKEPNKGTGLGLSTVYGIVKQSNGQIDVASEPGLGTTFSVYLPASTALVDPISTETAIPVAGTGSERILLVEDEDGVRSLAVEILRAAGYHVHEAHNGRDALNLIERVIEPFDLLITDIVMPELGGRQLAEQVQQRFPNIRVMYMSGYTEDAMVRRGVLSSETEFISKPFTADAFKCKVRQILDSRAEKLAGGD